jgi:signal transduction histidine kinase
MRCAVVSEDESLLALCRDVVQKLSGTRCEVVAGKPSQSIRADLYVWDMDSRPRTPFVESRTDRNDVFLVRRAGIEAFLAKNPQLGPNTLLKPVSPAALEVCLSRFIPTGTQSQVDLRTADRDTLLECLLHSSLRLQEFEEDRTNFWARAAHDMRAPLTAASGYCGLLLEKQIGPLNPDQQELLERIRHSLGKLQRMASAMFQLTAGRQIEGKYELRRTDIEESVNRSVDEVRIFASEKNLDLSVDLIPSDYPLYLEPNQIEQVLINLLENACKFTPRNGHVKIRAYPTVWSFHQRGGAERVQRPVSGYRIDISDSGAGIAPEQLPTIFDEYVSYGSRSDRSGGGLGLAICKMIVQAHHGAIWAESGDKGTTFSFVLPFNEQAANEDFHLVPTTRLEDVRFFSEEQ